MAVLDRMPHKLYRGIKTQGIELANGDYISGDAQFETTFEKCSVVRAHGAEREISFDDGVITKYSYTVYLSAKTKPFHYGDRVKIVFKNGTEKVFSVKGWTPLQLQTKVYV